MSDNILNALYGSPDPWAWRSDMNAGQKQPEATAWRPNYLSDNLPFMFRDALSAFGVSEREGMRVGRGLERALQTFPPTGAALGAVDLASNVGNALYDGRYSDAAGRLAGGALIGAYARNFLPGNRDAGMAQVLNGAPGQSAMSWSPYVSRHERPDLSGYFQSLKMNAPANVNDRNQFQRYFDVIGGGR